MRHATYGNNSLSLAHSSGAAGPAKPGRGRWLAHRWDLMGMLALIGSSAAYGVYALAHLGL